MTLREYAKAIWNSVPIYAIRGWYFSISEILTGYADEKKRFYEHTGYELNLKHPQTLSEHIVYKKIHDRNPVLPTIADKYKVRDYLRDYLGKDEAEKILIPLLYAGDPAHIPFDTLTGEYIIKANHNSGPHVMIEQGMKPDRAQIIALMRDELRLPYGMFKHEWAYRKITPRLVIVERLLRDDEGKIPKDYKFHMIKGRCAFVQIDFDRFTNHSRTLYDEQWNYIHGTLKFKQGPAYPKPPNFERMLDLAEKLSKNFDYLRVDLYSFGAHVYFGEMTHYPGSGMEKFTPISLDAEFGTYWQ